MSPARQIEDQGVDPNLRDGDGATPLHFAASRGHADAVRWLLVHGARLVLDQFGKSPINDAAENQQMEVRVAYKGTDSRGGVSQTEQHRSWYEFNKEPEIK